MERQNNLNKSIEKLNFNDGANSVISDTEEDPSLRPLISLREKMCKLFESHKFQICVIALVLIDCIIVVVELILEAKHHELQDKTIPHLLHFMSIGILSIFILEILLKIYAFGSDFFRHKFEIFDAFVVFLSFALDITFWEQEGVDLIIILRLWRVTRILNGVVMSIKTQSEHKLLKERQMREELDQELNKCRMYSNALEHEVDLLRTLLKKHGIQELPPSVVSKTQPQNTISVVAEVNQIPPL